MIFLFATELEAKEFRIACPHASIEICGVGAAQCAAATALIITQMKERGAVEPLILAGIAGSYSVEELPIGQVVEVATEQIDSLPERFQQQYIAEPTTHLRAVRSNSVNGNTEAAAASPEAQIENMEGAVFMAICQKLGVPHTQIRAISNGVGDPFSKWELSKALLALAKELKRIYF